MRSSFTFVPFVFLIILLVFEMPVGVAQTYCFDLSSDCDYQNAVHECMPPVNAAHGTPNTHPTGLSPEIQMIVTNFGPQGYRGEGVATNADFYPGVDMDFPEEVNITIGLANGFGLNPIEYSFEVYEVAGDNIIESIDAGTDQGTPEWQLLATPSPAFNLLFTFSFNEYQQGLTNDFTYNNVSISDGTRQLYLRPVLDDPSEPGNAYAILRSICISEVVKCGEGNAYEIVDDASFELSVENEGGASRYIEPVNFESYGELGLEVIHQWEVYDHFAAGEYVLIGQGEGLNFADTVDYHFTYTMIHRLITPCDTVCYAQTLCSIFNPGCSGFNGPVDCSEPFGCKAEVPSGLSCSESKSGVNLNWSAAAGANLYEVEVVSPDPLPFQCFGSSSTSYMTTTANTSIPLPDGFGICYCFRVRSICSSGSVTDWSNEYCNKGFVCGRKSQKTGITEAGKQFESPQFTVSPNPASGHVNIAAKIENPVFAGEILDLNGRVWQRFQAEGQTNHLLSINSELPAGVYVIRLKGDGMTISKKLLINR